MSSKVTGEDCAYIVKKLQRVSAFMRVVAATQPEEQASLHSLKLFISECYIFIVVSTFLL